MSTDEDLVANRVQPAERTAESTVEVVRRWSPNAVAVAVVGALAALASAVVLLVARGGPEERALLVRDEDGTVSLVDTDTGETSFELDDAFPTPDRSTLLTTDPNGDDTVLQSRDASTGEVTGSTSLDGDLHVRSVSPAGNAVVLMPGRRATGLYQPEPRTTTEMTIAYLDDRPAQQFSLDGNIEPEMLSLDETTLFLLDFVPPTDPTSYSVRKLDLATGEITDTDSIQVDLTSKMAGTARAQVMHPDGTFLYTLYTLPADQPIHDIEVDADAERFAFIHVISLDEKWSHCIFLPIPFGTTDEATIGMTISPDGETVLVADPAIGQIAEMDAERLEVTTVHEIERLRDTGARAVLARTGGGTTYVSAGNTVLELAPRTMEPVSAWGARSVVTGLSADDTDLWVASGGVVTLLDRHTGTERGVVGSGRGTVDLLGPPQGSVVGFPLECAC